VLVGEINSSPRTIVDISQIAGFAATDAICRSLPRQTRAQIAEMAEKVFRLAASLKAQNNALSSRLVDLAAKSCII
jgi:hypothetical protein